MCPSLPLYLCVFFALQLLVLSYLSLSLFCYHASPPCVSFLFSPLCHVNPCLFLQRTQCQAVCLSLRLSVFPVLFCTLCSVGSVLLPSVSSLLLVFPICFHFPPFPEFQCKEELLSRSAVICTIQEKTMTEFLLLINKKNNNI